MYLTTINAILKVIASSNTLKSKPVVFCNLSKRYEISKIICEEKNTKRRETIYQSIDAECWERTGIEKILVAENINVDSKLVSQIVKVNLKFGKPTD